MALITKKLSPLLHVSLQSALTCICIEQGLLVHQLDVVTAFLNGDLQQEIYMEQPPGYAQPGNKDLVCKLNKSLDGLKQSPRCWNQKFTQHMKSLGFRESDVDPCVLVRMSKKKEVEIVAVYVDDLTLITETPEEMQHIKESLSNTFKMNDLSELHYCLDVNVHLDEKSTYLCQSQYIEQLLDKYGLSKANTVSTPMDLSVKLQKNDNHSKRVDPVRYQSMVGSLLKLHVQTAMQLLQCRSSNLNQPKRI